jgi:hypothetical protein
MPKLRLRGVVSPILHTWLQYFEYVGRFLPQYGALGLLTCSEPEKGPRWTVLFGSGIAARACVAAVTSTSAR